MYKTKFREIAKKEKGEFSFSDSDVHLGGGIMSPNITYRLLINYKGNVIDITNSSGTSFVGRISCYLTSRIGRIDFNIRTRSHWVTMFSLKKKDRFVVTTESDKLRGYFIQMKSLDALRVIADKHSFAPNFNGEEGDSNYSIITHYHLEFDDWTQVLEPLIWFYKDLIDQLDTGNTNYADSVKIISNRD